MKIGVYSVYLNEQRQMLGFLETIKEADCVTLCDTGSTDASSDSINEFERMYTNGLKVHRHKIRVNPWSFATARNAALALVPADVDICIRMDIDERLAPGSIEALREAWIPGTRQIWYDFQHSPGFVYQYNCVHARDGFYWKGIDHEGLYCDEKPPYLYVPDFKIIHEQDRTKPRTSILGRLERQALIEPSCRANYYLGREYFYYQRGPECITVLQRCLEESAWDVERMDCYCMMAKCAKGMGNHNLAVNYALKAICEYATRESVMCMAEVNPDLAIADAYMAMVNRYTNKTLTIYQRPELW